MKDKFAIIQGFDSWVNAMDQLSKCDNGYLLSDFIDRYILYLS